MACSSVGLGIDGETILYIAGSREHGAGHEHTTT